MSTQEQPSADPEDEVAAFEAKMARRGNIMRAVEVALGLLLIAGGVGVTLLVMAVQPNRILVPIFMGGAGVFLIVRALRRAP